MKLFITGASGFLGKYVVAEALRQGHEVKAVIRPQSSVESLPWHQHPRLDIARLDLRSKRGLEEALADVDAVIHLAAVKAGDFYAQFAGTVVATENLLAAMAANQVNRLIAVSTFSVYDYLAMQPGQVLDETSPIEDEPLERDEYAQTKLIQEELVREFEASGGLVTLLRPGMLYGRECLWHALLGAQLSDTRWLKIGGGATMPMVYVENCAEAIIASLTAEAAVGQVINLVDDEPPTQDAYIKALTSVADTAPQLIPISWLAMKGLCSLAWWVRQGPLQGKARLPGILVPSRMHARFKPLQYSNRRAHELLNWHSHYGLEQALARSCSDENLLQVTVEKSSVESR